MRKNLADGKINVKIKIAALWTAVMFLYIYNDYFTLLRPGMLEEAAGGKLGMLSATPFGLFAGCLMMAVPAVMIFLSLILKPEANRIANSILGAAYTVISIGSAIGEWAYYIFMCAVEAALSVAIVWLAVKWPKSEE